MQFPFFKHFSPFAKGCAVVLLAMTMATPSFAQDDSEREAKLEELRTSIETLKVELQQIIGERSSVLVDLEASEKKVGELNKKVSELKALLEKNQAKLKTLHSERRALTSAKKQQKGQVSEHVNAAYRLGHQSSVKLLLNQNNPAKIARNLKYFNYLIQARTDKIQAFETTIQRLNTIEPKIQGERTQLTKNRNRLNKRRVDLLNAQEQRKHTLAKLESLLSSKDEELRGKEEDRQRLEKLVSHVIQVVGQLEQPVNTEKISSLKGKLPWPTQGRVKHKYGSSRIAGKLRWQGMVISANEGQVIKPIHYGQIVFSDYLRGHGLLVIIDHGGGFMSLYAHNQALYKSVGEWVGTHDTIATVGSTGGSQHAGLYFELRYKGTPTNPHRWLTKKA